MLKLKLQYFGHLMGRTDSLEKTLMLGKIEGGRRRRQERMRRLDGITDLMDMSLSKLQELVLNCQPGDVFTESWDIFSRVHYPSFLFRWWCCLYYVRRLPARRCFLSFLGPVLGKDANCRPFH